MKAFGLFSGIGGFELSLRKLGVTCTGLCEIDDTATSVLTTRFPGVRVYADVTRLRALPRVDVVTAGFPCQDLSQAGPKSGITGRRSGLVDHVFRLLEGTPKLPDWIVLENVSYMLRLHQGAAMSYLLRRIESMGFNWAYRVLDARAFGIPQRRERVILVLSKAQDPSQALFPNGYVDPGIDDTVGVVTPDCLYGFYWTEGKRGLGWTKDAVPTIKGGSGVGIPSPPAIWNPKKHFFGTPSIRDAERLFGFPAGWTEPAESVGSKAGARWKLVGNTVCVPMIDWVMTQLLSPRGIAADIRPLSPSARPPGAAYGSGGKRWSVEVSTWPETPRRFSLSSYLRDDLKPLSHRATAGFFSRAGQTRTIRFADGFLSSMSRYLQQFA